jgi:hypothetical protein
MVIMIEISKSKRGTRINIFIPKFVISFSLEKIPNYFVYGISAKQKNGFIVLLDYDDIEEKELVEDLKRLMEEYYLDSFIYYESSKGRFHSINPSYVDYKTLRNIILDSKCDKGFKYNSLFVYKIPSLRMINEINNLKIVKSNYSNKSCRAVLEYLEKVSNTKLLNQYKKLDRSRVMNYVIYSTIKSSWWKE